LAIDLYRSAHKSTCASKLFFSIGAVSTIVISV
jgi:hypothetical protein